MRNNERVSQEIDKDAVALMTLRILKKEQDNAKTGVKTPDQMVNTIRKIIEEEVDSHVD